ncbi:hypothetical protein C8Q76DRAFT_20879 [Earliella scabrosa]|nr:hypothetical protein C8Q76DRAFT_20879 [Earliella scabrosa]
MGAGHRVREGLHLRYTPVGQRTTNSLLALARSPDASIPVYTFCVPMSSSPTFSHGPPSSTPAPPTTIRPKRPRCSPSSRLPPLSPFLPRDEPIVDTPRTRCIHHLAFSTQYPSVNTPCHPVLPPFRPLPPPLPAIRPLPVIWGTVSCTIVMSRSAVCSTYFLVRRVCAPFWFHRPRPR